MTKTYLKYFLLFSLFVLQDQLYSQEALRIFDLRKKNKTFSLADLQDLDLKKISTSTKQVLKQEKENAYYGPIFTVDFTKDDKYILGGGTDGSVQVWNVIAGTKLKRVECHEGRVLAAKFFLGAKFFSTSDDGEIFLYNGSSGKREKQFVLEDNINQAISYQALNTQEGDNRIITRKESQGKAEPGMEKRIVYHSSLDYSSDKKFLAVGADNAVVSVFDINSTLPVKYLRGHKKKVNCVAFKPTKHEIVSGSDDNNIILWNWENETQKPKILKNGHQAPVLCLAFPRGIRTLMASGSRDNTIKIWNMTKDSCVKTLEGHEGEITSLAFTKNGKYLVSGSLDNTIRIWDVQRERTIKLYTISEYPVQSIALSNNENFIISGGLVPNGNGALRLWQLNAIITDYESRL